MGILLLVLFTGRRQSGSALPSPQPVRGSSGERPRGSKGQCYRASLVGVPHRVIPAHNEVLMCKRIENIDERQWAETWVYLPTTPHPHPLARNKSSSWTRRDMMNTPAKRGCDTLFIEAGGWLPPSRKLCAQLLPLA